MTGNPVTFRSIGPILLALTVLSLGVHLAYVHTLHNQMFWGDEVAYDQLAIHLLHGDGYVGTAEFGNPHPAPSAYWPCGVPFVLTVLYALFGPHIFVARVFQSILAALLVPLAYHLALALGQSKRAGLIASAVVTLYPYYIYCSGAVYPVMIATFLICAVNIAVLRGMHRKDMKMETGAGLTFGAALLAVPYLPDSGSPGRVVDLCKQGGAHAPTRSHCRGLRLCRTVVGDPLGR